MGRKLEIVTVETNAVEEATVGEAEEIIESRESSMLAADRTEFTALVLATADASLVAVVLSDPLQSLLRHRHSVSVRPFVQKGNKIDASGKELLDHLLLVYREQSEVG